MQHLATLVRIANTASDVIAVARKAETYRFEVRERVTLYIDTANADVRIVRHSIPRIELDSAVQAPFAWRIVAEQDEAGVYFVARRKPIVGTLASGRFTAFVPETAHVVLKLASCRLSFDDVTGMLEVPPGKSILPAAPLLTAKT